MTMDADILLQHLRAMDRQAHPGFKLEHLGRMIMPKAEYRDAFFALPLFHEIPANTPEGHAAWAEKAADLAAYQISLVPEHMRGKPEAPVQEISTQRLVRV